MLPWESRRTRRNGRARRRPDVAPLERLEPREVLTTSALGVSLPDLTVKGFAAPTAAWGQPLSVTVDVQNIGSNSVPEPFATLNGGVSSADSQPTTVLVFASPRKFSAREVPIGSFSVPAIVQNSFEQITQTLTLPQQPAGFGGHKIFLRFVVNPSGNITESDVTNNSSVSGPVRIDVASPGVVVTGLDLPPVMQPGDTIQPDIELANVGTTDVTAQTPVTVDLVASVGRSFGPGSSIVAQYSVTSLPAQSKAPNLDQSFAQQTVNLPPNITTIVGAPVTLPVLPKKYFLGVVTVIDGEISPMVAIRKVGPPIRGLPPAGVLVPGGVSLNQPFPTAVSSTTTIVNGVVVATPTTVGNPTIIP